jgi:hypothetical protein
MSYFKISFKSSFLHFIKKREDDVGDYLHCNKE